MPLDRIARTTATMRHIYAPNHSHIKYYTRMGFIAMRNVILAAGVLLAAAATAPALANDTVVTYTGTALARTGPSAACPGHFRRILFTARYFGTYPGYAMLPANQLAAWSYSDGVNTYKSLGINTNFNAALALRPHAKNIAPGADVDISASDPSGNSVFSTNFGTNTDTVWCPTGGMVSLIPGHWKVTIVGTTRPTPDALTQGLTR